MSRLRQCAILVGGSGSRLGSLTRDVPKPMLPVAGRPFLQHLLDKAHRHGFESVLLLAGFRADVIQDYVASLGPEDHHGLKISVSVEPAPLGTAGALAQARDQLEETFLLVNGDTWFDFDWSALTTSEPWPATLALRQIPLADRYETILLADEQVTAFQPRGLAPTLPGLINGGAYRLQRAIIPTAIAPLSLETDILPDLCRAGQLGGRVFDGDFIDIGVPESYADAQSLLARRS
jgi:NDP-sugar pyrophosphorylase family protein